jgi:DNA-binding transcriptional MocR family regulator
MTQQFSATQRRNIMRTELEANGTLSVHELVTQFGVSKMTIHRDLDALSAEGIARKIRGGAVRVDPAPAMPAATTDEPFCTMCSTPISDRTAMMIHSTSRGKLCACCPHCGLMMLQNLPDVDAALARDYLYGRMINAMDGYYLLNTHVHLCCVPSVLCFATRGDAERFQQGFGGDILTYDAARTALRKRHSGMVHTQSK